jgi:hypothetical protein
MQYLHRRLGCRSGSQAASATGLVNGYNEERKPPQLRLVDPESLGMWDDLMNPMDFILLIVSIAVAVMSVVVQGWTLNGIGPALLASTGGIWQFWMQWLRHLSWLHHRESGSVPGTQHLAISAAVGWFLGMAGAMLWILATRISR